MKSPADHPDFTAMALGEHIDGTPPQAVLDALHQNPAARREADAIRSTAQRLSSALGSSGSHSLDSAARLAILNADPAAVRARFAAAIERFRSAFRTEPRLPAFSAAS